jgi:methylated-DNA-[protein]-cysteine S-methyltransferase
MTTTTSHPQLATASYASPLGTLALAATTEGLRAVLWPRDDQRRAVGAGVEAGADRMLAEAARQLDEYFAGARTSFDLQLDLRGTAFQLAAWNALAEIPFGETRSYAEQAERIGRPAAYRAVGAANGRNPLSIVLPCHRVLGSDGSLTGFAGGLDAKRRLLDHERAVVAAAHLQEVRSASPVALGGEIAVP